MILRDRDNSGGGGSAWLAASDGTLEERRYSLQNWRADVSAIVTDMGVQAESVKYSSYGVAFGLPAGDTNADGKFDSGDVFTGTYTLAKDVNLDGVNDAKDQTAAGSYVTMGRGTPSSAALFNRLSYAAYPVDQTTIGTRPIMHVRNRVLDGVKGSWTRRDPLEYIDGANLYISYSGSPLIYVDPFGLQRQQPTIGNTASEHLNKVRHTASCGWIIVSTPTTTPAVAFMSTSMTQMRIELRPACNPRGRGGYYGPGHGETFVPEGSGCDIHNCVDLRQHPNDPPSSDGCGAGPLNPHIPENPFGFPFELCCDDHDIEYSTCTRNPRTISDAEFCECLNARCDANTQAGSSNASCYILAWIYCTAVNAAGGFFYCDAQSRHCICCDPPNPHPECMALPDNI